MPPRRTRGSRSGRAPRSTPQPMNGRRYTVAVRPAGRSAPCEPSIPLAAVGLWACLATGAAHAAPNQPTPSTDPVTRSAVVTATTAPITIDGALDEPIWRSAPKIGDLVQREPNPGQAPTERTEVTLLHDRDNLHRRRGQRLRSPQGHRNSDGAGAVLVPLLKAVGSPGGRPHACCRRARRHW